MTEAAGVLSISLGFLLFANPSRGATTLPWTVGVYAIALGAVLIGLGFHAGVTRHDLTSGHVAAA